MRMTRQSGAPLTPEKRVYLKLDQDLVNRIDAYRKEVHRSRNAAVRYLLHVALSEYEEAKRG